MGLLEALVAQVVVVLEAVMRAAQATQVHTHQLKAMQVVLA
jgi:hypothetical protein